MSESTALALRPTEAVENTFGPDIRLDSMEKARLFADMVVKGGLAPKGANSEGVMLCVQAGYECGLSPMASIQSIAVINGRTGVFGDTALALCRRSGLLTGYKQTLSGQGNERKATVTACRGDEEVTWEFSVADANKAGLWGKPGPWSQFPDRMLVFRARGFVLRDLFGDVLKGMSTVEELRDITPEVDVTVVGSDRPATAETLASTPPSRVTGVVEGAPRTRRKAQAPAVTTEPQASSAPAERAPTATTAATPAPKPAEAPKAQEGASTTPFDADDPASARAIFFKRWQDDIVPMGDKAVLIARKMLAKVEYLPLQHNLQVIDEASATQTIESWDELLAAVNDALKEEGSK